MAAMGGYPGDDQTSADLGRTGPGVLGHVNLFFALCRPCLSVLSSYYRFAAQHLGKRAVVWPNLRREMREVMGLAFLLVVGRGGGLRWAGPLPTIHSRQQQ